MRLGPKVAYFDCAFGAAGDMLLGALVDAGLSLDLLNARLSLLGLPADSYRLSAECVRRCSIQGTRVHVDLLTEEARLEHTHAHEHSDAHSHSHELTHAHSSTHSHDCSQVHSPSHSHDCDHTHDHPHDHHHEHPQVERSLSEILALIENSALDGKVKELSSRIFSRLGEAESRVHGVPIDQIHFHEVGALDAIIDIIGFAIGYHELGIEKAVVSPLPLGSGMVKTMHGLFPVPGPATLNLLASVGAPTGAFNAGYECLTPTGAAILTTIADEFGGAPAFRRIDATGYGAGTLDPSGHPNLVRVMIGEPAQSSICRAEILTCLECNIDDCSPQILAYAAERLLEAGALDVTIAACLMKKGRSGHLLSVLCEREAADGLAALIMQETTTLGVRSYQCERLSLARRFEQLDLFGKAVQVKVSLSNDGTALSAQPEYDDCVKAARELNKPLKEVIQESISKAREKLFQKDMSE